MSGTTCIILYSEIDKIRVGTPELAMCLKAAVRAVANDLENHLGPREMERVETIGRRGEFNPDEQRWLRDTLLGIAEMAIPYD